MSCGLRDVMELETLGTPAVLAGQPALRRVHVDHPVQDRTDDELRAMAREAIGDLLDAIT